MMGEERQGWMSASSWLELGPGLGLGMETLNET